MSLLPIVKISQGALKKQNKEIKALAAAESLNVLRANNLSDGSILSDINKKSSLVVDYESVVDISDINSESSLVVDSKSPADTSDINSESSLVVDSKSVADISDINSESSLVVDSVKIDNSEDISDNSDDTLDSNNLYGKGKSLVPVCNSMEENIIITESIKSIVEDTNNKLDAYSISANIKEKISILLISSMKEHSIEIDSYSIVADIICSLTYASIFTLISTFNDNNIKSNNNIDNVKSNIKSIPDNIGKNINSKGSNKSPPIKTQKNQQIEIAGNLYSEVLIGPELSMIISKYDDKKFNSKLGSGDSIPFYSFTVSTENVRLGRIGENKEIQLSANKFLDSSEVIKNKYGHSSHSQFVKVFTGKMLEMTGKQIICEFIKMGECMYKINLYL